MMATVIFVADVGKTQTVVPLLRRTSQLRRSCGQTNRPALPV